MGPAALLFMSCWGAKPAPPSESCQPDPPAVGEVRAKRVSCAAELPENAEGRIGDWMLETAELKLIIRNTPNRMTQLDGAGGTIIDAAVPGRGDALTEILPHVEGGWPDALTIRAEDDSIYLQANDGTERLIVYTLQAGTGRLTIEGSHGATLVPAAGSTVTGEWLNAGELCVTADEPLEDDGGWVHWASVDSILLGSSATVSRTYSGPAGQTAEGTTDGDWVEVGSAAGLLYRARTSDGKFRLTVPENAQLRTTKSGHAPSSWVDPAGALDLRVGQEGFLALEVHDELGSPIPATLTWNGIRYVIPDEATEVPVGPGLGSGLVTGGPEYEPAALSEEDINGTVSRTVQLKRIREPQALAAFHESGFPDATERRLNRAIMLELAADGVDYAVLGATDEVSQTSGGASVAHLISVSSASRSGGPLGEILAWPWSGDSDQPAHGAVDWRDTDPLNLVALMSKFGRRYSAITAEWLIAAEPPQIWDLVPTAATISDLTEVDAVTAAWDAWAPLALVGRRTWVNVDGRSKTEVIRGVLQGRTVVSTGPQLHLRVGGASPGEAFDEPDVRTAEVWIDGPGDIGEVRLIGKDGREQGPWDVADLPVQTTVSHSGWVAAVAEGSADWAVTSPVWLSRPE